MREMKNQTGLSGNKKLYQPAAVTIESAEREFKEYGNPVKRYHNFMHQAGSWKTAQKVMVKVEVSSMGTNIRYIVTNLTKIRAKELYEKGYGARGTIPGPAATRSCLGAGRIPGAFGASHPR